MKSHPPLNYLSLVQVTSPSLGSPIVNGVQQPPFCRPPLVSYSHDTIHTTVGPLSFSSFPPDPTHTTPAQHRRQPLGPLAYTPPTAQVPGRLTSMARFEREGQQTTLRGAANSLQDIGVTRSSFPPEGVTVGFTTNAMLAASSPPPQAPPPQAPPLQFITESNTMHGPGVSTHNLSSPISELNALSFDSEYSTMGELAEVTAVEMTAAGLRTGLEFASLVKIPAASWMYYGNITSQENEGAPPFSSIAPAVKDVLRKRIVLVWNKSADMKVLFTALDELHLALEDVLWLDPMVLARRLGFTKLSLEGVGSILGMEIPREQHRGRADVMFM